MKIKKGFEKILIFMAVATLPLMARGVTDREMEQARTIATKNYLRYANDGSGYLDDVNANTMAELEAALKTKEKENIKAFKAIPVPSDYKSWDKEKLVEYWAVTAYQTKGLLEKGRGGRIRTRSQINKMTITPPSASAAPEQSPTVTGGTTASPAPFTPQSDSMNNKNATNADILLNAEGQSLEAMPAIDEADLNVDKERNFTWVYIMVLSILVALVIALVVYAAKVMKTTGINPGNERAGEEEREQLEHLESSVADKNVEISRLNKRIESLTRQNGELQARIEALNAELTVLKGAAAAASVKERETPEPVTARKAPLRSIFLGRANSKGIFVRADRTLNVGNSIFVLETSDGYSGSFKVADSPAAWSLALSNPKENLENACTGRNLDDTQAYSRIVTESSGTAVFEGGCWRVIRKARISYEV